MDDFTALALTLIGIVVLFFIGVGIGLGGSDTKQTYTYSDAEVVNKVCTPPLVTHSVDITKKLLVVRCSNGKIGEFPR